MDPRYIAAGGQILQQGGNMLFQNRQNELNRNFAEGQSLLQRQWANEDWEKTNAYNAPIEQKKRMIEAGLNPNMMYGGGGGSTPSATVRGTAPAEYKGIAPQSNINFQSLMQIPLMMEQTRQLQLINEAKAIDVRLLNEATGLAEGPEDAYPGYEPAEHLDNNPYKLNAELKKAEITAKNFTQYINDNTSEEQIALIVNKALVADIEAKIKNETSDTQIELLRTALDNSQSAAKLKAAQVKLQDMEIGMQSQYYIGTLIKVLSLMK